MADLIVRRLEGAIIANSYSLVEYNISRDKLARFLCGWLGGPKLYNEKYGSIGIPQVHAHLAIATTERDQWLTCMSESVAEQAFEPDFKKYLMEQLYVPAEAVRRHRAALEKRKQ